jgi:uncharacterized protein DUF5671
VTEPAPDDPSGPFSGRAAFAIAQAYYYVAAAIGLAFLVGGAIAALIALRQWVLPSETVGPDVEASREAARSFLGALAFAIPGALAFTWHLHEARARSRTFRPGAFWGSSLYFHLVALIALGIAIGGVVALLHSLRDAALPQCYQPLTSEPLPPVEASPIPGVSPGIEIPIGDGESPLIEPECFPPTSDALRSAIDAAIVTVVAGGVWVWHLGRGRREHAPPAVGG